MMNPVDITDNNTPIAKGERAGDAPKTCGCGGKGKGACGTTTSGGNTCGCGCATCRCGARFSCGSIVAALIVAIGLALSGWFVGHGVRSVSDAKRNIDVRGLAERDIEADLAVWNIGFVATGGDIAEVQAKVEADGNKIRAFLKDNGLSDDEMIELPTSMVDLLSRDYRSEGADKSRYIVNAGIRVRSKQVASVKALSGMKIGALIKAGVTLKEGQAPVYLFTKLKEIKPVLVAEATDDARRAAETFAKDSGAKLGNMKSATQGLFQILPRDQADGVMESAEIDKTIRVVTTVTYALD